MFAGYKTYIVAGLMAAASAVYGLGYIDRITYEIIMGVLTGGGVATLRSGITEETKALPK